MTKFCMWVDIKEVITCATFGDDLLWVLDMARGRISHFPIDLRRHPYHARALSCEFVITNCIKLNCHVVCPGVMQLIRVVLFTARVPTVTVPLVA